MLVSKPPLHHYRREKKGEEKKEDGNRTRTKSFIAGSFLPTPAVSSVVEIKKEQGHQEQEQAVRGPPKWWTFFRRGFESCHGKNFATALLRIMQLQLQMAAGTNPEVALQEKQLHLARTDMRIAYDGIMDDGVRMKDMQRCLHQFRYGTKKIIDGLQHLLPCHEQEHPLSQQQHFTVSYRGALFNFDPLASRLIIVARIREADVVLQQHKMNVTSRVQVLIFLVPERDTVAIVDVSCLNDLRILARASVPSVSLSSQPSSSLSSLPSSSLSSLPSSSLSSLPEPHLPVIFLRWNEFAVLQLCHLNPLEQLVMMPAKCVLCYKKPRQVVLTPCNHFVSCVPCWLQRVEAIWRKRDQKSSFLDWGDQAFSTPTLAPIAPGITCPLCHALVNQAIKGDSLHTAHFTRLEL